VSTGEVHLRMTGWPVFGKPTQVIPTSSRTGIARSSRR